MKFGQNFRNPGDLLSDDEDMDELGDNDEIVVPLIVDISDSEGSEFEAEDYEDVTDNTFSDESMDASDDGTAPPRDNASGSHNIDDDDIPTISCRNEDSPILELNEDDEDDETVRAMIAAIKKQRSAPPEIKLEDSVTDMCFHPGRNILAVATITGDICLYEYAVSGNKLLSTIEVHAKSCRDVEFTLNGFDLISCSKDKSIMITDTETERLKKFYESAHDDAINKLHVLDENLFATGDDSGTVKLWDLRTKNAIFALKEVQDYITQIMTNDSNKLLLFTSGDGHLTTINIGSRKLYVKSEEYEEEFTCMGTYRSDSKLVVGTSKGRLYSYNWGQFGYHSDMYPGMESPMNVMIPVTDRIGCVACEDGNIRACNVAPFRNLGVVGQHSMPIECLDISADGILIASSSHNNDIRFWDIKYFENIPDIKYNDKHNKHKERNHNLPSSKYTNASDFFADLSRDSSDDDDDDDDDDYDY